MIQRQYGTGTRLNCADCKSRHYIKSLILSKAVNNFNEAVPTFYLAIAFIVLASCTSSEVPPSSIRYYSGNPISKVVTLDKNFKIAMGQSIYVPCLFPYLLWGSAGDQFSSYAQYS